MATKIPQDVTREDRLVGPLTLKQFLYVLGGASIIFIAYQYYALQYLFFIEFAVISIIAGTISIAFAFVKVNGRPFGLFAANAMKFWTNPKLRTWHKEPREATPAITAHGTDVKDTKTEIAERHSGKEFQTQREKLSHLLDTGGTMKLEDADAVTSHITNLNASPSPINEAGLDVEDVLAEGE